jgi:DNA-damage-inducible protein J
MMMAKTAVISARIDPELKRQAEQVFHELGLTTTQAITMFYKQVELQHGLPFAVKIPNQVTNKALREAQARQNLEQFNTVEDLFEDLGI